MKKIIPLILALIIGFQTVIVSEAFYSDDKQYLNMEKNYLIENTINKHNFNEIQPKSAPKYISKKAIKWIIKNTTTNTNIVGKNFGRKAAVKVGNVIYNIKPALRALEKFDKITYGRLNSAILKATGSKTITYWIMLAIEIVAPI